ncbi:MBL fold metallo-hydrolase [Paenisporosarcina cavernae]|uniref:MBL fold metallo-hydrolase n=1 Tax=Paenisporosarcina cavernae TaxID=2320858 RepID=A0A385YP83_9BACL|nr:MBL fold metallo-hydrolase [Paenisporosarcina cavernae]AYC28489.1 MBL fold metallo-hydrolase [Paenisporosarcina cavernae]
MRNYIEPITDTLSVIAIWDTEWKTWNNSYIFQIEKELVVIDSCKNIHLHEFEGAINTLRKEASNVTYFLATHGHEDHVQGSILFPNAKKLIHPEEIESMEYDSPSSFTPGFDDAFIQETVDVIHVETHTKGSVAFYHSAEKALFTGDFLCFFGDPLSQDGFIGEGQDLRIAWLDYMRSGSVKGDYLQNLLNGLRQLVTYDVHYLCTGHGCVLVGNISLFLQELLDVGEKMAEGGLE